MRGGYESEFCEIKNTTQTLRRVQSDKLSGKFFSKKMLKVGTLKKVVFLRLTIVSTQKLIELRSKKEEKSGSSTWRTW